MFDTSNRDALDAQLDSFFERYGPQYPPDIPERDAIGGVSKRV